MGEQIERAEREKREKNIEQRESFSKKAFPSRGLQTNIDINM